MTPMQVKMPQNLTIKDVKSIIFVYSHLSLSSKQNFLASLMINHPEHYERITKAIGTDYQNSIPRA